MNFTRTPAFTLQRSDSKMKFQVKSIIIGLSITLVILLVYVCTLPSTQPQDTNNLRWLQNIIDENKKRKMAMQSLYKPKIGNYRPKVPNHPFLFPTTSPAPYPFAALEKIQNHAAFQKNRAKDFDLPFNKFAKPSDSTSTNWKSLRKDNQLMNKGWLGKVGSKLFGDLSTTSSAATRPITKYNHAVLKSQLWKFGLPLFSEASASSSSTTGSMTTSTSATINFDRLQQFFKQKNNYPSKFNMDHKTVPQSGYGLKAKSNEFNPQKLQPETGFDKSFERQTLDKLNAGIKGDNVEGIEDETKNRMLSAYEPFQTPGFPRENHAANPGIPANLIKQNSDKMIHKEEMGLVEKTNFAGKDQLVLPRQTAESLHEDNPDKTFPHQLNKDIPSDVLPEYEPASTGKISQMNNKPRKTIESLLEDNSDKTIPHQLNKDIPSDVLPGYEPAFIGKISQTNNKQRKTIESLPEDNSGKTFPHQLNKATLSDVLPGYKSASIGKISQTNNKPLIEKKEDTLTLGEHLLNLKQNQGVKSNPIEKSEKMPIPTHTGGVIEKKPAKQLLNKGLIQGLTPSLRSRLNFCKMDATDKPKPGTCAPLQTLTSVLRICTHPLSKDSGVSKAIHNSASWEFNIARDVQVAILKDDSTGLIDIGAGIGVYSIIAASFKRQVIAVEPFQPHIRLFQKSIALNKLHDYITLICNAVSDVHETVKADPVPGDLTQVIWNYVPDKSDKTNKHIDEQRVKTITFDDLATVVNLTSAVLKLDIPDYDNKVLKTASRLFNKVNILYVFMHWSGREKIDLQETMNFFVARHYQALDRMDGQEIDFETLLHSDSNSVIWKKSKSKLRT